MMIKKLIKKLSSFLIRKKEKETKPFFTGMIWIGEKETDWKFAGNTTNIKRLLNDVEAFGRQPQYEYNQWAQWETRNWCTIYSAITELSYLYNYEFTLCQIREIGHKMIEDWKLDPNYGAYLSDAIDYTRRWWNEKFPNKKVESYQISYLDRELRTKLISWKASRLTQLWYRTSPELFKELQSNWFAMKTDYPKNGWHAVSQYWLNTIDNYKWKNKNNRYSFHNFYELVKNWVIFEKWYIFLKQKKNAN